MHPPTTMTLIQGIKKARGTGQIFKRKRVLK